MSVYHRSNEHEGLIVQTTLPLPLSPPPGGRYFIGQPIHECSVELDSVTNLKLDPQRDIWL